MRMSNPCRKGNAMSIRFVALDTELVNRLQTGGWDPHRQLLPVPDRADVKLFLAGLQERPEGRPSDRTPSAGKALHDLALGVVREYATVVGEIGCDLALGTPLLRSDDGVEGPAPERLAPIFLSGFDRGRSYAVVRVGKCAHDGLVFAMSSLRRCVRRP